MDYRIVDSKIVVQDGIIVSLPPNHFGINKRNICYYGTAVRLVHSDQARMKWYEDNSVSVETLEALKLETAIPLQEQTERKRNLKFELNPQMYWREKIIFNFNQRLLLNFNQRIHQHQVLFHISTYILYVKF